MAPQVAPTTAAVSPPSDPAPIRENLGHDARALGDALEPEPAATPDAAAPWNLAYQRGRHAQADGDLDAAVDWYRQAVTLNPNHAAIVYDLGYALQLQDRPDAAIRRYRRAIEINARHSYAYYNLGYLLQRKGEDDSAIETYEKAAALDPGNPYVYYNLARIMEERGDLAHARALYRRVVALGPKRRPGVDARERLAALGAATSAALEPGG
jgi:tetratricopeptide (TPR) repeat protein